MSSVCRISARLRQEDAQAPARRWYDATRSTLDTDAANAICRALVKKYDPLMRKFACGVMGDEGNDAVNDVWEAILRSRRLLNPPQHWRPYLFKILRRKMGAHRRQNPGQPAIVAVPPELLGEHGRSAFDMCDARVDLARLSRLIPEVLSLPQISTLVLAAYGFPDREIAELAGVKDVAKVRARAVKKLRKAYGLKAPKPVTSRRGPRKG